jgi:hypothetical protein
MFKKYFTENLFIFGSDGFLRDKKQGIHKLINNILNFGLIINYN